MSTETLDQLSVTTKANVYFDGKCVSHSMETVGGEKLSVGVVLPAELTFSTGAAETMECVAGACEYRLAGSNQWLASAPGHTFAIAANSTFDIRVSQAYHYICRYV